MPLDRPLAHGDCASLRRGCALHRAFEPLRNQPVLTLHHARQPLAGPRVALSGACAALHAAGDVAARASRGDAEIVHDQAVLISEVYDEALGRLPRHNAVSVMACTGG